MVVLIGVAYQEMISPIRDSVRASGFTLGTVVLFSVFFLTSMRFFMGNQLHLMSPNLVKMKGMVWFYDLIIIVLQTTVMIFLGGVSSVEVSRHAKVGFVGLLIALYIIDIVWVLSQWFLGVLMKSWRRHSIPWSWCILNSCLVLAMLVMHFVQSDFYSTAGLLFLGIVNTAAFVLDVVLIDYYDVI